jgi:hypothetical protein
LPFRAPDLVRARFALGGGVTAWYVAVYVAAALAITLWLSAPPSDHDTQA